MTWCKYPDKGNNYVPKDNPENPWYKYWQYKPWKIKDDWTPLRKNWRKHWPQIPLTEQAKRIAKVVNLTTFWASEITSQKNIDDWIQPFQKMNTLEACREAWWTNPQSLYQLLARYPELKKEFERLKKQKMEYLQDVSVDNIWKAIKWEMKWIKNKEKVDYSFRLLEKTHKDFNPTQKVEQKIEEVNAERTAEDIMDDLKDLLW